MLGLLFIAPLSVFILYAFLEGELYSVTWHFTLGNFTAALSDPVAHHLLVNSIVIASITAGASLVLGLVLAYYIRFEAGCLEYPVLLLVVISMFASYLARIYSWRVVLGENGLVNEVLDSLHAPAQHFLFTRFAVIVALVQVLVPYVALTVYAAMRNLPRELLEVSSDLGATWIGRWRRVLIPLLAPAIVVSFAFTFILAASDWAVPQLLGGVKGNMIGLLIQVKFIELGDFPLGAALSLLVLVMFLCFYGLLVLIVRTTGLSRVPTRY
jgi:spermidine/putrescine transport system permease protein